MTVGGHSQRSGNVTVSYAWRFSGKADGGGPSSGALVGGDGTLYGTVFTGATGFGAVYSLRKAHGKPWQNTTIWDFTGAADGAGPTGRLLLDGSGALYGVTGGGAAYASGTVFKLTPPASGQTTWTQSTLYTFTHGDDGGVPVGGLIADAHGNLYGTTTRFGSHGYGTVFKLSPPAQGQTAWTFTLLYSFTGGGDGGSPLASLIMDAQGNLYGTAPRGGTTGISGCVFELMSANSAPWQEQTLWEFSGSDGAYPSGPLIADTAGNLYGTTPYGGSFGQGVAFKLSPPMLPGGTWMKAVLWNFSTASGVIYPFGGLLADNNGNLFGAGLGYADVTYPQSPSTIFVLQPPAQSGQAWTETTVAQLDSRYGYDVYWPLAVTPQGALIAVAQQFGKRTMTGGRKQTGSVLEITGSGFVL